jgi:hypothetical protein
MNGVRSNQPEKFEEIARLRTPNDLIEPQVKYTDPNNGYAEKCLLSSA